MAAGPLGEIVAGGTTIHLGIGACTCTSYGQCWACTEEQTGHVEWHDEPATTTTTDSWHQLDFFPGGE